jgi:hypothetical protein
MREWPEGGTLLQGRFGTTIVGQRLECGWELIKDYITYRVFAIIYFLGLHSEVDEIALYKLKASQSSLCVRKRETYDFLRVKHEDPPFFWRVSMLTAATRLVMIDDRMVFFLYRHRV